MSLTLTLVSYLSPYPGDCGKYGDSLVLIVCLLVPHCLFVCVGGRVGLEMISSSFMMVFVVDLAKSELLALLVVVH